MTETEKKLHDLHELRRKLKEAINSNTDPKREEEIEFLLKRI